ncbi:hypothetical protein IAT38_000323 [Cryptococcus sp. DSM 104549]
MSRPHISSSSSRPIAPIPHHSRPPAPRPRTPYTPVPQELHAGARNRLFLALRSSVESEVDWALPRLVVASQDDANRDMFRLEAWVDSVAALSEWPRKWLEGLEKEAAVFEMRAGRVGVDDVDGVEGAGGEEGRALKRRKMELALGVMPEWVNDPLVEQRATNSLLVLRNASFTEPNAKLITRPVFLSFVEEFFTLPIEFLQHVILRSPEPVHHILTIVQSIFPYLRPDLPGVKVVFGQVFPRLLIETRDLAMMVNLVPLIIYAQLLGALIPPPPADLIPHLLQLLVVRPSSLTSQPSPMLELVLDLLISLSSNPTHARTILSLPEFPHHLKSLVALLEHEGRASNAAWNAPRAHTGVLYSNPASASVKAQQATARREAQRVWAQRNMQEGGRPVYTEVGDSPPALSEATKQRLYGMKEPDRSIAWMRETFVYNSTSHIPQVTFWHSYREFFQNPSTKDSLISAADVIKNVSKAFEGVSAKVWVDEHGQQKFVIAGMGFRKVSDEQERFTCLWEGCQHPTGPSNPSELLTHIQLAHLHYPTACCWARCSNLTCTTAHILTHLPLAQPTTSVPERVLSHPSVHESSITQPIITTRPAPPLPSGMKLNFVARFTPIDARGRPRGVALLAALALRNLARTLRGEIALAAPQAETTEEKAEKKKHLLEERYGLPIPDSVLKEEEEEEEAAKEYQGAKEEGAMGDRERERAKEAFEGVEMKIAEIVGDSIVGLGQFLGGTYGW